MDAVKTIGKGHFSSFGSEEGARGDNKSPWCVVVRRSLVRLILVEEEVRKGQRNKFKEKIS